MEALRTNDLDILTYDDVKEPEEWRRLAVTGRTLDYYRAALPDCPVRRRGLTIQQRPLAAAFARSGGLDSLRIECDASPAASSEIAP